MSDIHDTIDSLRDQVEALLADNQSLVEANREWSELMENHDVAEINELIEFDNDFCTRDVRLVLNNYDLDDLKDAADKIENYGEPQELAERVEELEALENKIEEYGDPQQLSNELQELKDQIEEAYEEKDAADTFGENDPTDHADIANTLVAYGEEVANLKADLAEAQNMVTFTQDELAAQSQYVVQLKTEIAQLDANCIRLSDELERTYGTVPYKALYESQERELCVLRCNMASLKAAHEVLRRNYFSEVSGFDDVPSSKPDDYNNQGE